MLIKPPSVHILYRAGGVFMDKKKMQTEISGFVLSDAERNYRNSASNFRYRKRKKTSSANRESREETVSANSMLIKFSICAASCAAVLLLKWADIPAADSALSVLKTAVNEEYDPDDALGRLKFVELPGMIEVFADSIKLSLPLESGSKALADDSRLLVLTSAADSSVKACMNGTVKETGIDGEYGNYVRIRGENDTDLFLYGLSSTTVEAGQPVHSTDDVGSITAEKPLYVRLTVEGRPQNPADHFSFSEGPL